MKTNELIENLSKSNKPVNVIRFGISNLFKVIFTAALCVVATVSLMGFRIDIFSKLNSISYIIESFVLLLIAVLATTSAFDLSVPGNETKRTTILPLFNLFLWIALTIYSFFVYGQSPLIIGYGFACATDILATSLAPAIVLFLLVRKAAPLNRKKTGFYILLAGAAYGAFIINLTCSLDSPAHIMFWHIFPTLLISLFGYLIGSYILKRI